MGLGPAVIDAAFLNDRGEVPPEVGGEVSYQYLTGILPVSYQYLTSISPVSHQYLTSILAVSYQYLYSVKLRAARSHELLPSFCGFFIDQ